MLLFIRIDVIWVLSGQLNEWVEALIHRHAASFEVRELLILQLHSAAGHVVGTKLSFKLIPHNQIDVCVGIVVRVPPICCHRKELVCGKKNFLIIRAMGDHELHLYGLEPILALHGIISSGEGGGASSQKLSQMRLVRWRGRRCLLILKKKLGLIKCLLHEISNKRFWHNSS
jgi:hypothetical protein